MHAACHCITQLMVEHLQDYPTAGCDVSCEQMLLAVSLPEQKGLGQTRPYPSLNSSMEWGIICSKIMACMSAAQHLAAWRLKVESWL